MPSVLTSISEKQVPVKSLPQKDRAGVLDALRGFALLGICIANAGYFSMYVFLDKAGKEALPSAGTDQWLHYFIQVFIDGKFYSLFSLLFGLGFAIIFFEKQRGSVGPLSFFYRRLLVLLVFGLAHSFLLWDGDILFFYALVGALLPLFRKLSDRTLLIIAAILICSPLVFDTVKVLSNGKWNISSGLLEIAQSKDQGYGINEQNVSRWLIENDSYAQLREWSDSGFWWSWHLRVDSNRIPKVLAMFLVGLYLGRSRFYNKLAESSRLLKKLLLACVLVAIPAGICGLYFSEDGVDLPRAGGLLDTLFYALNVAPLSLAYACLFALAYAKGKTWLSLLEPMGRMALTNYIAQSFFGVFFYYGMGAGLGVGKGPSFYIPVAFTFFLFQLWYSQLWMQYFRYGPLEWIWRQLTYGRLLPLRREKERITSI